MHGAASLRSLFLNASSTTVSYLLCSACIVYDISDRQSFENVKEWLAEIDVYSTNSSAVKMLVANKIDMVPSLS